MHPIRSSFYNHIDICICLQAGDGEVENGMLRRQGKATGIFSRFLIAELLYTRSLRGGKSIGVVSCNIIVIWIISTSVRNCYKAIFFVAIRQQGGEDTWSKLSVLCCSNQEKLFGSAGPFILDINGAAEFSGNSIIIQRAGKRTCSGSRTTHKQLVASAELQFSGGFVIRGFGVVTLTGYVHSDRKSEAFLFGVLIVSNLAFVASGGEEHGKCQRLEDILCVHSVSPF